MNALASILNPHVTTYAIYLAISLPLTYWVARNLHKNGRVFLIECLRGDEKLADSVNQLLVVGFCLVNFGFVSLHLKVSSKINETQQIFEAVSSKIGIVLLILGVMHFFNLYVLESLRRRARWHQAPPIPANGLVK